MITMSKQDNFQLRILMLNSKIVCSQFFPPTSLKLILYEAQILFLVPSKIEKQKSKIRKQIIPEKECLNSKINSSKVLRFHLLRQGFLFNYLLYNYFCRSDCLQDPATRKLYQLEES
jgi:hypothetical protein